jgi:energy-coupling factor transport system permease protein
LNRKNFFGQYQYSKSILHSLDPRIKILSIFYIIIFLFFIKSIWGYLILLAFVILLVMLSRVNFVSAIRSLKPILYLLIFTVLFQIFFTPGKVVYSFHFVKITKEGLNLAMYIAIRLMLLSLFTFILTSTTSSIELSDGFQSLISPLKIFHFPSDDIALMISISLQFVPILFEEADRIMKAQISRGADFDSGSLVNRAKSFLPLILPLLLNAFNRADQLAIAMEARGFVVGGKRTPYRVMKIKLNDCIFIISVVAVTIFSLFW